MMKLNKNIMLLTIFFLIYSFSLFANTDDSNKKNILINATFSRNFKFNGKNVIFDLTNDIKMYKINKNDSIEDFLIKNNFVYKKEDIDVINKMKTDVLNYFKDKLDKNLEEKKIYANIKIYDKDMTDDNYILLDLNIDSYDTGEYNLIKNRPTAIAFDVFYYKILADKNKNKMFSRRYQQKEESGYPLESMRINRIVDLLSLDVAGYLKNHYLLDIKPEVKKKTKIIIKKTK